MLWLKNKKQNGSVLIISLFIIFFLAAMALVSAAAMRIRTQITGRLIDEQRAFYLAQGAVNKAIITLKTDRGKNDYDSFDDQWFKTFQKKDRSLKDIRGNLPANYIKVKIEDEAAKININLNNTERLQRIVWNLGIETKNNFSTKVLEYKENILKKKEFVSVWQIKQMQIVPDAAFLGEDINENGMLDDNENDGAESFPLDNIDGKLDLGVKDFISVYAPGRVNINTASEVVLKSMPKMNEELAGLIIKSRSEKTIKKLEDLKKLSFVTAQVFQDIEQWADVKSDIFKISASVSVGKNNTQKQIIAIVDRSLNPVKILFWREI